MSKVLFNEQPIVISRELAKLIGLNESIVIQQVHYWIEINKKANRNFHEGKYWVFNSIKAWHEENFNFWSVDTVKRTFSKLEKLNLIFTGNYNKDPRDQTKWYTINYELLEEIMKNEEENINEPIRAKCTNAISKPPLGQNAPMEKGSLHQPLPEITTEIKEEEEERIENASFSLTREQRKNDNGGQISNLYTIYDTPCLGDGHPPVHQMDTPCLGDGHKGLPNEGLKKEEEERIENASFSDENKEEFQELNLEILDQYKKNISSKVSNNELETLLILQEQVGTELVVKAIEIACDKNGKNIAYIKTLLEDWTSKGLTTPEEVDEHLNKWKEKNQKARENREKAVELRAKKTPVSKTNQYSNRDNVPQMRNYEEREYDDDFFENLYRSPKQVK